MSQAVGAGTSVGSGAATGAILGTGIAAGALTAGIGAGIAIVASLIMGAWAAHKARAAGAKTENAAVNSAVQAFDQALRGVFDAANKGTISATDAINFCNQIYGQWWSNMAPYQSGPGRADASGGGANCEALSRAQATKNQCNTACTAGCCVGCMDVYPTIQDAIAVFQRGGGTVNVRKVFGSGYGALARESYSLTYVAPPPSVLSAGGLASAAESSVGGIPVWMWLAGGAAALYAVNRN